MNAQYAPAEDQGKCTCKATYAGEKCDKCATNYYGPYCSTFCTAKDNCGGRGKCNANGACECNPGFGGSSCELKACAFCNDHGACDDDKPLTCNCFSDYTGSYCEYRVTWKAEDWGSCYYENQAGICGAGTAKREISCEKTNYVKSFPPEPSCSDKTDANCCPILAVQPTDSIKCVHATRPLCDCERTPVPKNGLEPICLGVENGKTCGLRCEEGYTPMGSFTCANGAYLKPYPECVPSATASDLVGVTAYRQSLAFQLKPTSDVTTWDTGMRDVLPNILSIRTGVPVGDIEVSSQHYHRSTSRRH